VYKIFSLTEKYIVKMSQNLSKPKKIIRHEKKSFPLVRDKYKRYNDAEWEWTTVINFIENERMYNDCFLKDTSKKFTARQSRDKIFRKYKKWQNDMTIDLSLERRGIHNKIFTIEQERLLFEYIKVVFIDTNLFFDDTCLKFLAISKWNALFPTQKDEFKASNGWIYEFKKRWSLSTFTARHTKLATNIDDNKIKEYLNKCAQIDKTDKKFIFNTDETFWRFINGNFTVIGITGSENRKLITGVNNKSGFTVIFTISADGNMLKPIIIMKGKTERCLKKSGSPNDDIIVTKKFSESGTRLCRFASLNIALQCIGCANNNVFDRGIASNAPADIYWPCQYIALRCLVRIELTRQSRVVDGLPSK
jgi:hypothetical protein